LVPPDRIKDGFVADDIGQQIGIHARTSKGADRAFERFRIVARHLQGFPGTLEENSLLRINDLGLARVVAEEGGVKHVGVREDATSIDVTWVIAQFRDNARFSQLFGREGLDGLDSATEIVPESINATRARKASGHADDGYAADRFTFSEFTHERVPPRAARI
jgi:hypothetical protein